VFRTLLPSHLPSKEQRWLLLGWGIALVMGIATAVFQVSLLLPVVGLLALSLAGLALAFAYPRRLLLLLLLLLIPTTDAQLIQTPLRVPGTNFTISYVDPFILLIAAVWILGVVTKQKHLYRHSLNAPFALFFMSIVGAAFIGFLTGARPGDIWIALRPPLMYFLAYVVTASFTNSRQVKQFLTVCLAMMTLVALWGIYLTVTGQGTTIDTQHGRLALRNFQGAQNAYLVIGFLMILGMGLFVRHTWLRGLAVLVTAVMATAVLFSFVRGNWLGSAVGVLFLLILLPRHYILRFLIVTSSIIVTFLFAFSVLITVTPEGVPLIDIARERFLSIFIPSASTQFTQDAAQSRVFELQSGLPLIRESPLIGHGYGHYFLIAFERGEPTLVRGFHNSYLTIAFTNGALGLLAFLWLCATFLLYSYRLSHRMPMTMERGIVIGLASAFAGTLAASIFNFYLFDVINLSPFLGSAIGIVLLLGRENRSRPDQMETPAAVSGKTV
jgi:O-antigen ligase